MRCSQKERKIKINMKVLDFVFKIGRHKFSYAQGSDVKGVSQGEGAEHQLQPQRGDEAA